jgi:hypothetical protein
MGSNHNKELTILEAVDHLSALAELDQKGGVAAFDKDKERGRVRESFRAVHRYLQKVYETEREELGDLETQRGIHAVMVLAGEAAQKVDKFTALFKGVAEVGSATELTEYKELQQFYLTKIIKRFQHAMQQEEAWTRGWAGLEEKDAKGDLQAIKGLESVRRDQEYELFYMRRADGTPFFSRSLLRHIRLVGNFDEMLSLEEGENPVVRLKQTRDKALHLAARSILQSAMPQIDQFIPRALQQKEDPFIGALLRSVMALMLAANPRNLLQNTTQKSAGRYFADFHLFLREALTSKIDAKSLPLAHALCGAFFYRQADRADVLEQVQRLVQRGERDKPAELSVQGSLAFWNGLLDQHQQIRSVFARFPNGPLLNVLEALREEEESEGFDPLHQHNPPEQLFSFACDKIDTTVLRLPTPTCQTKIDQADVVPEFTAFLSTHGSQPFLLFNLQDRTSWKEHARSTTLEGIENPSLVVVTLPKNTDFYHQSEDYMEIDKASDFIAAFEEQLASPEQCGFFFPSPPKDFRKFTAEALKLVHREFFHDATKLARNERMNFIEIVYQLLMIKWIDHVRPGTMSLTCKDGLDTGAAASATLFSFLRLFSQPTPLTKKEQEFILWLFHAPALLVRERAIDFQAHHRAVTALATVQVALDQRRSQILAAVTTLFGHDPFPNSIQA